ncbi:hypothetical protein N0V88_000136 [Collariella sp. IMI 366227]|nr:hypothetical protein N0V88_000136 [Collariella sp. IMI 366227]
MSNAENSTVVLNGDSPHSSTLRHLLTYPAVQDGLRFYKSNTLGRISIELSSSAYQLVGAPVLSLLDKPYGYVAPYLERADNFGDETLSKVEKRFPQVKKPAPELYSDAKEAVYSPVKHVTDVYNGAFQRTGGAYPVATGVAAAKTAAVLYAEGLIFTIRSVIKVSDNAKIRETLEASVSKIEAAIAKEQGRSAESQNGAEPKGTTA